ncbi:MAG: type IV secretion system DNA-binding domain-containing protein [Candidatus Uhrbacteria bacterium]
MITPYNHEHEDEVCPFAQTNFRGQVRRFGIKTDDRRRHMYFVGKTGMGKTSMLEQMMYHDIQVGHGCAYLDPHGDTADLLLDYIPNHRLNDVIYFNPSDLSWPIAFNVLEQVDPNKRHLVASGLIGIFKKIWADSWGPRLEYVLRNAILALMDYPGTTLLGIMRILVDKEYRRKVISMVQDPVVKSFWVDEYARYPDKFQTEAIAPIQNKVGQFLSSALVRNIVGQTKSKIRIQDIMDNRKVLIMNLAKGGIGEDITALLGAMMVTKVYLAAMERVSIPEADRQDFYLYVDEFQNFATDSFADILSEARKYNLNLTIAHQYVGQLMTDTSTRVRDAVFGNVGTLVSFRVGAADAEWLEPEFQPTFLQEDIVNLPKWSVYLRLMINGVASEPFSAGTLLPIKLQYEKTGNREKVIEQSRERYCVKRDIIETKIARWTGMLPDDEDADAADETPNEGEWKVAKEKARELTRDSAPPKREAVGTRSAPRGDQRPPARTARPTESRSAAPSKPQERRSAAPTRPPERTRAVSPKPAEKEQSGGEKSSGTGSWMRDAARERADQRGASAGSRPDPRIVECSSCGSGATVYFQPRAGQRVLCENCLRGEKEKKKMAEFEEAKRKPRDGDSEVGEKKQSQVAQKRDDAPRKSPPSSERRGGAATRPSGRNDRRDSRRPAKRNDDRRPPRQDERQPAPPSKISDLEPVQRGGGGKELSLADLLLDKSDRPQKTSSEPQEQPKPPTSGGGSTTQSSPQQEDRTQ